MIENKQDKRVSIINCKCNKPYNYDYKLMH